LLAVAVIVFVGSGVYEGVAVDVNVDVNVDVKVNVKANVGDCPGWFIFVGVGVADGRTVTIGMACAVKLAREVEVSVRLMEVGVNLNVAVGKLVNVVVGATVGEKKRVANASWVSTRSVLLVAVI
jgi:ribosomal protein S4E